MFFRLNASDNAAQAEFPNQAAGLSKATYEVVLAWAPSWLAVGTTAARLTQIGGRLMLKTRGTRKGLVPDKHLKGRCP